MTRVLVVDDQDLVRAGLAALLRAAPAGYAVEEASDGSQAITLAAERTPDVILMDIRMPDIDGITAIRRILSSAGDQPPRILVLTTFDLDEYVHTALQAGASGFLLKSTPADRLFAAIESVAAGDMAFTPAITHRLIRAFSQSQTASTPPDPPAVPDELTARERDVLQLVGSGMSNSDIAAKLVVTEATVKTHLYRTMTKLGLTSRAQAVVYAYETQLVVPRPRPECQAK